MIPLIIIIISIVILIWGLADLDGGLLVGCIEFIVIAILVMSVAGLTHRVEYTAEVERQNLAALSLDQTKGFSGGSIYLLGIGSGSVSSYEIEKYRFFAESQDKGYALKEAEVSKAFVKMDLKENEQPYAEIFKTNIHCEDGVKIFPLTLWGFNCIGGDGNTSTEYIFHIPDGSLVNDYELDLNDL